MDSPTSAVTRPAQKLAAPRLNPKELWEAYTREAWTTAENTVDPRTRQTRQTPNPNEWMAHCLTYVGYADGKYTIRATDEWQAQWANVKLAKRLGLELTLYARAKNGIDKQLTVTFVSDPPPP